MLVSLNDIPAKPMRVEAPCEDDAIHNDIENMMMSESMADREHVLLQNGRGDAIRLGTMFSTGYRTSIAQAPAHSGDTVLFQ
jgi:hypothetical protein